MNAGSSNRPGMPIECDRSAGPTNRTSTPSMAAVSPDASTAAGDSTWNTPSTRSLTVVARSAWAISAYPPPRVPSATPADPGRRVAHPGQRLGDLGGRLEARDHQPVGAEVERPADAQALGRRDAHHGGRRRALDRQQLGVEVGLGAHAVLEVDEGPVEARPGRRARRRPASRG